MADVPDDQVPSVPDPMIPGGRDPHNLTHREAGAMGGQFTGADIPPDATQWLDEPTAHERAREGGGADGEHDMRARERRERDLDKKRD
jgi:hypothetical protein